MIRHASEKEMRREVPEKADNEDCGEIFGYAGGDDEDEEAGE